MSRADSGFPAWLSTTGDERVWFRSAPSGKLVVAAMGVAFAIQVATVALIGVVDDLGTARLLVRGMVALTLGVLLLAYYVVYRRDYVLTDSRACVGVGVFSKRVEQVDLDRVEDVIIEQSSWQPWMQTGTIRFVTAGGDAVDFAFVEHPHDLYLRVVQHAESRAQ